MGVLIGRVLERCEALDNEGCGQGLGAVDLNAATSGVIGVGDMVGHERLLDEMNAGAQDDSDRLAFGGLMLLYNTSSLPRSLASRVLPSSMFQLPSEIALRSALPFAVAGRLPEL
ncbi:hypothetical protein [Xanthomonas cannabis]|uniref:hypothetical protein n=1 Tax=Xanthomonas cannabis TaxID=1885674 RepID=UPI00163F7F5D|nr:hypothetical protein [Xanthomonas cannabis]